MATKDSLMTAQDFLTRHGLTLAVKLAKVQKCPASGKHSGGDVSFVRSEHNHGPLYRVVIRRRVVNYTGIDLYPRPQKSISFDYFQTHNKHGDGHYFDTCDLCLGASPGATEVLVWLTTSNQQAAARVRIRRFLTDAELKELSEVGR